MFRKFSVAAVLLALCSVASAATCYVTEFVGAPPNSVYYQAVNTPAVASQAITFTGTSTQSAAFNASTGIIRVHVDAIAQVEIGGTNPTAGTTSMRMTAGQTEYFVVKPGQKLAVKTGT